MVCRTGDTSVMTESEPEGRVALHDRPSRTIKTLVREDLHMKVTTPRSAAAGCAGNATARRSRFSLARRAGRSCQELRGLARRKDLFRVAAVIVVTSAGVLTSLISSVSIPGAEAATVAHRGITAHVSFTGSQSPAYANDAPDPDLLYSGGTYYAFTTGTALGNHIQALTSASPAAGWQPYTGGFGSSALPSPPAWETVNTQTSPGVFFYGGHWVMFYDASVDPNPEDSGHSCLSVATAATLTPPVFSDTSGGPLYCGAPGVGVLDPSPFVDPASGTAYLLWKSNDGGGSPAPSQIWSAQLSANGTSIVG